MNLAMEREMINATRENSMLNEETYRHARHFGTIYVLLMFFMAGGIVCAVRVWILGKSL